MSGMIAKAGGYYREMFKGARGVTQEDPLSPTIFNVVVYVLVWYWVTVMMESSEEWNGRGQEGRHHNALFYADDGMVASPDPRWIQGDFGTLVGLFDRVGMNNNVGKKFIMVCCPSAYVRRMTGSGPSYRESQWGRIQCTECGE